MSKTNIIPAESLILRGQQRILKMIPSGQDKSRTLALMLRIARSAELQQCEPMSVVQCVLDAASMGLSLTPNMGEAYILPTKIKDRMVARLEPGYKGYIALAKRAGIRNIEAEVVRKGDDFSYTMGLHPTLHHVRNSHFSDPMTHVYAKARIDGEWIFRVLDEKEVLHAKLSSKSAKSEYSPWSTHPEAMWRKTAIKRLLNSQSLSSELNALVGYDTNAEVDKQQPMVELDEEAEMARLFPNEDVQDVDLPE